MDAHFAIDQHAELDFHSASLLQQQSTGRDTAPLGHIILSLCSYSKISIDIQTITWRFVRTLSVQMQYQKLSAQILLKTVQMEQTQKMLVDQIVHPH